MVVGVLLSFVVDVSGRGGGGGGGVVASLSLSYSLMVMDLVLPLPLSRRGDEAMACTTSALSAAGPTVMLLCRSSDGE